MDSRASTAAAVLAQKRAKQAAGAARKLARLTAQVAGGFDSFGACEVRHPDDVQAAVEMVELALAEHGQVDVVLLVSATPSDGQNNHHGPRDGAKGATT